MVTNIRDRSRPGTKSQASAQYALIERLSVIYVTVRE